MIDLPARADIVVVGAGIAGAATAYFLARGNADVMFIDRSGPAAEASGGNAGMIGESGGDPTTTMQLQQRSIGLYQELQRDTSEEFELEMAGRLRLAMTDEEARSFEHQVERINRADIEGQMVYGADIQQLEPALSSRVLAAAWFPGDGKIHPVKATNAYSRAAVSLGARRVDDTRVTGIIQDNGRVTGLATDRGAIQTQNVVLAAGAWTPHLAATAGIHVPGFPGKGHMLATEPLPPITNRVLRAEKLGTRQLANGEMLIGSEVEHVGFDKSVNPATIELYLRFMQDLVPELRHVGIARSWGCIRPMSIDQLPIVGAVSAVAGLYLNTGHGRSGMGLAPATSEAVAELLLTGHPRLDISRYRLDRFMDIDSFDRVLRH
jgi:D-hydroxyproline dehydrogenase subunit beta